MDKTLRQYLEITDETHKYIDKYGMIVNAKELKKRILTLQMYIKNLQAIAKKMADVSNTATQILLLRKKNVDKVIDPYPTENDHATLRMSDPYSVETKEIIEGVKIPVKMVANLSEIPVSSLYYVESHKQFAFNILGINIKGNLANISNYGKECTASCEYRTECKSFKKNVKCKYYHDPEDFINLGIDVPNDLQRNFTVGSWIYSKTKKHNSYFARHVGSLDSLALDLYLLRKMQYKEEVYNREGQLIHDLLIYLILHNQGYLEKYPNWLNQTTDA